MASLIDFMPYLLPYVPGCSYPMAEQFLRDTCIDFCTVAPVAQIQLDPIDAKTGVVEYDLDAPVDSEVAHVYEASFLKIPLGHYKLGDSSSVYFDPDARGTPTMFKQSGSRSLILNIAPGEDVPKAITGIASVRPTRTASTVPDILLSDYARIIAMGAVSNLVTIPNKPYSHPELFALYSSQYTQGRAEARIRAEASFGRASSAIRPRRFI